MALFAKSFPSLFFPSALPQSIHERKGRVRMVWVLEMHVLHQRPSFIWGGRPVIHRRHVRGGPVAMWQSSDVTMSSHTCSNGAQSWGFSLIDVCNCFVRLRGWRMWAGPGSAPTWASPWHGKEKTDRDSYLPTHTEKPAVIKIHDLKNQDMSKEKETSLPFPFSSLSHQHRKEVMHENSSMKAEGWLYLLWSSADSNRVTCLLPSPHLLPCSCYHHPLEIPSAISNSPLAYSTLKKKKGEQNNF